MSFKKKIMFKIIIILDVFRMAGVTTKGNTDDGCEPLPIPTLMVGFESEWVSVSPLSLYHWDSLSLEPWGPQR